MEVLLELIGYSTCDSCITFVLHRMLIKPHVGSGTHQQSSFMLSWELPGYIPPPRNLSAFRYGAHIYVSDSQVPDIHLQGTTTDLGVGKHGVVP